MLFCLEISARFTYPSAGGAIRSRSDGPWPGFERQQAEHQPIKHRVMPRHAFAGTDTLEDAAPRLAAAQRTTGICDVGSIGFSPLT